MLVTGVQISAVPSHSREILKAYYKTDKRGSEVADLIINGYHDDKRKRRVKNIDELNYDDLSEN